MKKYNNIVELLTDCSINETTQPKIDKKEFSNRWKKWETFINNPKHPGKNFEIINQIKQISLRNISDIDVCYTGYDGYFYGGMYLTLTSYRYNNGWSHILQGTQKQVFVYPALIYLMEQHYNVPFYDIPDLIGDVDLLYDYVDKINKFLSQTSEYYAFRNINIYNGDRVVPIKIKKFTLQALTIDRDYYGDGFSLSWYDENHNSKKEEDWYVFQTKEEVERNFEQIKDMWREQLKSNIKSVDRTIRNLQDDLKYNKSHRKSLCDRFDKFDEYTKRILGI